MADTFLFKNNATSTLASGITAIATTLFLSPGDGVKFPSPAANQHFSLTIVDSSGNIEIVYCSSRTTDTLTISREEEGTTGLPFDAGDVVELRLTGESCGYFVQQGLKGYSAAAGSVNAITMNMTPALTSMEDGTVFFVKASGANTITNPTLDVDSLGAKTIVKFGNQSLVINDIPRIDYECIFRYNLGNDNIELLNPSLLEKPPIKDWGTVTVGTQIDLEDADLHIIEVSANLTLTFASANTNDKSTIAIHNSGSYTITVAGIDNNSPTLTVGTNIQDIIGLIKSHGKITNVGIILNQAAV